jgi:hypothetical protein
MSVTECAVSQLAANHVIVFFKDSNHDVHAFEFGEPEHAKSAQEEAEAKTGGHHIPSPHSQQKHHEHHEHQAGHGSHGHGSSHKYAVHTWSPISTRPVQPSLPAKWKPVGTKGLDVEGVFKTVKHGCSHHQAHQADGDSFIKYVMGDVFGAH